LRELADKLDLFSAAPVKSITNLGEKRRAISAVPSYQTVSPVM
jgi:hypothetical protein